MSNKDEHFMAKHKGPARQFLALVGDDNGAIKTKLDGLGNSVESEEDCYYIDNYYYSAKYSLKKFAMASEVAEEFRNHQTPIMCVLVAYKTLAELEEVGQMADLIKADTRVIVVESTETCTEYSEIEDFATRINFEVVYMNSSKQQLDDARELGEAVGIDRLVEIIQVCNWPWRMVNSFNQLTGLPAEISGPDEEERHVEFEMGHDEAGLLLHNYREWMAQQPDEARETIPAPQHAERVHLSPDSPTTTEGTTNPDDVNISVDIDLVYEGNKEYVPEKRSKPGKNAVTGEAEHRLIRCPPHSKCQRCSFHRSLKNDPTINEFVMLSLNENSASKFPLDALLMNVPCLTEEKIRRYRTSF